MASYYMKDLLTRIAAICAVIPELKVFTYVPRKIDDTDLPCIIVYPGSSKRTRSSGDSVHEDMMWSVQLFLANAKQGGEGQGEEAALDLQMIEQVLEEFDGRPMLQLNGDAGIIGSTIISGHDGLEVLSYPMGSNSLYFGVVFRMSTSRQFRVSRKA